MNVNRLVFRSDEFPEVQVLVTGDIHKYVPPYAVQFLLDTENIAFVNRHRNRFVASFAPLVSLGDELNLTNYVRTDDLGIRLKTNYASPEDRNRVFSVAGKVIFDLYHKVGGLTSDTKITSEPYNPTRHLGIPFDLWPHIKESEW